MNMKNKIIIIAVVAALTVGAGSFYAGMKYAQSQKTVGGRSANFNNLSQEERQQRFLQTGGGSEGRIIANQSGAGFVNGEIIAKDNVSVTVKLRDGGSKIIFYSASTQVQKMADAPLGDLTVGNQAVISGTVNSDGTITAQTIQLRPNALPSGSPDAKSAN